MKNLENKIKGNSAFTLIEGCVVAAIGAILVGTAVVAAAYVTGGAIGWSAIRKHVLYEDKYVEAVRIADNDKNGDLDQLETKVFFDKLGVVKIAGQKDIDVRPSYKSLNAYIDKKGN